MKCYKEVHKYNGEYFSRFDLSYQYRIGEMAYPKEDNFIYATLTIDDVLDYAYVGYDIAILEMEIPDGVEKTVNGYIVKAKAVKVIKEVPYERINRGSEEVFERGSDSELYRLLKERRQSILHEMQTGVSC